MDKNCNTETLEHTDCIIAIEVSRNQEVSNIIQQRSFMLHDSRENRSLLHVIANL